MSDQSRRKLLKSIAAGSGAVITGKSLPENWTKPVVDSVILPSHAETSPLCSPIHNTAYPSTSAVTSDQGDLSTVGATEGQGSFFQSGDYMEETVNATCICSLTGLSLDISMFDTTGGCQDGVSNTFDVIINDTTVGTYQFTSTATYPDVNISVGGSYTFAAIPGQGTGGDEYTIRIVATSSVCSFVGDRGGAWDWRSGGSVTLSGTPC